MSQNSCFYSSIRFRVGLCNCNTKTQMLTLAIAVAVFIYCYTQHKAYLTSGDDPRGSTCQVELGPTCAHIINAILTVMCGPTQLKVGHRVREMVSCCLMR